MPFPKFSALHTFCEFIIEDLLYEDVSEFDELESSESSRILHEEHLPINHFLNYYQIAHTSFKDWQQEHDDHQIETIEPVVEYYNHLKEEGPLDTLIDQAVEEVLFYSRIGDSSWHSINRSPEKLLI